MRNRTFWKNDVQVGLAYALLGAFSVMTTRFDGGLAYLWLSSGFLIAVLKRTPKFRWPRMLLACGTGSVVVSATVGVGLLLAAPLAMANIIEAVIAALLIRHFRSSDHPLGSLGWTVSLVVAVGLIGPFAMAAVAAGPIWLVIGTSPIATFSRVIIGHGLSNIVTVPIYALFAAGLRDSRITGPTPRKCAETLGLFAIQLIVTVFVFRQSTLPLLFLAVLPSVVIAFRSETRAVAISLILLALVSGPATMAGLGPIHLYDADTGPRMQLLGIYLVTIVLTIVPIAAGMREHKRLMRRVTASEQRYRMLADHSGDVIMHSDRNGIVQFVSPSIERLAGFAVSDMLGKTCVEKIHPDDRANVESHYEFALLSDHHDTRFEYRAKRKDGRWCWFESRCRGFTDTFGSRGVISIIRDISERKEREDELALAAMTDPLTGLPNRRAFREAAAAVVADQRIREAAIALIDIDFFKSVNDEYGHDAGDEVLQSFAAIAQQLRRKGDMMARIGGEEFALLLPGTSEQAAIAVCERLRTEVSQSVNLTSNGAIRITISGGVAALDADGLDVALKRADRALYRAKHEGRDRLELAAA